MAFSFGSNNSAGADGGAHAARGPDIAEIYTEAFGYRTLSGEKKLKLLPEPWPTDALPPSSSSLLSVASQKGLLAAASPQALVVAKTEDVRKAIRDNSAADNVVTDFAPAVSLQVPRLSHVAFSSGETYLAMAAQEGGGLAIYEVASLGSDAQPAFQIGTNKVPVRALIPNPNRDFEHLFAVLLDQGQLVIADLKEKKIASSLNASGVLWDGVTCVSWSNKGRALVAGLKDGKAVLLSSAGNLMATVPYPPDEEPNYQVASAFLLSNEEFFLVYCPESPPSPDEGMAPENPNYFVQTNKERNSFAFSKLPVDPFFAVDMSRSFPPQHYMARLRNWPPSLDDVMVLTSSNTQDIITITNSSTPLAQGAPTNNYTLTQMGVDARKAALPMATDGMGETVALGFSLDLSAKENVLRPIPMEEEIENSPTPLPALLALTNEGLLVAWWIVYNESIKQGTGYPGLTTFGGEKPPSMPKASETPAKPSSFSFGTPSTPGLGPSGFPSTTTPAFGQSSFGTPSGPASSTPAFGKPAFGSPSAPGSSTPTFGKPSFGAPSGPGSTTPAFSKPAFGAPSQPGGSTAAPAFGATGGLGNRSSPLSSAATPQKSPTQNQQPGFSAFGGGASGFAKFSAPSNTNASTTSSFSSFTSAGSGSGFANLGKPGDSIFGSKPGGPIAGVSAEPSFGSTVTVGSSLGGGSTLPSWGNTPANTSNSLFGGDNKSSFASTQDSSMGDADNRERDEATPTPQAPPHQHKPLFGLGTNGFKLDSSFKGDGSAKDDLPKPAAPSTSSLFGGDFGSALDSQPIAPVTPSKKADEGGKNESTTPASLPPSRTPAKAPSQETPASVAEPPLPPDPMTFKPKKTDDDLPPLAGSPAVQVEAPESSVPSSPLSDGDDEGEDERGGEEEEEDEEDEEEEDEGDISVEEQNEDDEEPVPRPSIRKSGWSFQDSVNQSPQIPPQAPTPPIKQEPSRSPSRSPSQQGSFLRQSNTPAGLPKTGPFPKGSSLFPPTTFQRPQDALRSPSPVRSASTSALGNRQQPPVPPPATPSPFASSSQLPRKPPTPAPVPTPEVSELSDDENELIREELRTEVRPSRDLDSFIAHQDYTGSVTKQGVPGQIELLYRDINSMVDTLGLNARSLAAFIKYHTQQQREGELTMDELDDIVSQGEDGAWFNDWVIDEIEMLMSLEDDIEKALESGKLNAMHDKLLQLSGLHRDVGKLNSRVSDLRQTIANRRDPEKVELLRLQALPKDQADQQKSLRFAYADLLKHISRSEEGVVLLKSKLAALNASRGQTKAVPTVDAVKKTITRLTGMIEKKNSDIDVLESQLRKFGLGANGSRPSSSSRSRGTPLRNSTRAVTRSANAHTNGSSFATPPTNRSKLSLPISELNRRAQTPETEDNGSPGKGFGLFFTPDATPTRAAQEVALRTVEEMDEEDLKRVRGNAMKRSLLAERLTAAVLGRGTRVTRSVVG